MKSQHLSGCYASYTKRYAQLMNMKYSILLIILLKGNSLLGQDYLNYFHKINNAKLLLENGEYIKANNEYERAFSIVKNYHSEYIEGYIKTCKKLRKRKKVKELKVFLSSNTISNNQLFTNQISRIHSLDQKVRTKKYVKARNFFYKSIKDTNTDNRTQKEINIINLIEDWRKTDSTNIETILGFISKYGFPSERKVGLKSYHQAIVILLHFDKDENNERLAEILDKALKQGEILPKDYAWIIDRRLNLYGNEQLYYSIPFNLHGLSKDKLKYYNTNRHKIGMPKLNKAKIKYRGNSIVVKQ